MVESDDDRRAAGGVVPGGLAAMPFDGHGDAADQPDTPPAPDGRARARSRLIDWRSMPEAVYLPERDGFLPTERRPAAPGTRRRSTAGRRRRCSPP